MPLTIDTDAVESEERAGCSVAWPRSGAVADEPGAANGLAGAEADSTGAASGGAGMCTEVDLGIVNRGRVDCGLLD